jgi:cytochrome c oxidase subunit 3
MARVALAHHFASLEQQAHAARLAMWAFLASEIMLFTALFAMYAGLRCLWPDAFRAGVHENDLALGTLNTFVLITSSLTVALALHATRVGRRRLTAALLGASIAMGAAFLIVKAVEYGHHFAEGAWPGTAPPRQPGLAAFRNLYFASTGLHALHVIAGMALLAWLSLRALAGDFGREDHEHVALELGGMYWHLVDVVWIFLWPLYYLLR